MTIDKVVTLVEEQDISSQQSDYSSDSDESVITFANRELIAAVRKELAPALKDLVQHGLMELSETQAMVPFGCFSGKSRAHRSSQMMHAWDILLKYYDLKKGRQYNETPARKLSEAFDLTVVGGKPITSKQTLLSAIDDIITSHGNLRRSPDAHFKAFVCTALNHHKLVGWMRLVLRNSTLVEYYYEPWSYLARTGFEDTFRSLERLTNLHFNLPVDLSVRHIREIKDAF